MTEEKAKPLFKGACKVQFIAAKEYIESQSKIGYPLKEIWRKLQQEDRFSCSYDNFTKLYKKAFNPDEKKEKSKANNTKNSEPVIAVAGSQDEPFFKRKDPSKENREELMERFYGKKPTQQ